MYRQDVIKRAIEQLAAALRRAAGLARSNQPREALECLSQAESALPIVPGMLDDMDAAALLEMVGRKFAAPARVAERGDLPCCETTARASPSGCPAC